MPITKIMVGSLLNQETDAIAIPFKDYFNIDWHYASSLSKCGGPRYRDELSQLKYCFPSDCVIINAYGLKCKKIMLVNAGTPGIPEFITNFYHNMYAGCLRKMQIHGLKSIAFPIFGLKDNNISQEDIIKTMFRAITHGLKVFNPWMEITIVLEDEKVFNEFRPIFDRYFDGKLTEEELKVEPTPISLEEVVESEFFRTKTVPEWIRYYKKKKHLKLIDCYQGIMSKTNFFKMMKGDIETDKYKLVAIGMQMGLDKNQINDILSSRGDQLDETGQNGKDLIIATSIRKNHPVEHINHVLKLEGYTPLPCKKLIKKE